MNEAETPPAVTPVRSEHALREVVLLFLKLGTIAFGGPAAHTAMMRDEVVRRRGWLEDREFLDLMGATNLIPGPNSTELAIHLGRRRAGWKGLVAGGAAFILPAVVIVLVIAWAYVRYGTRPAAEWLLYGVKPVIVAVVAQALWGLTRTAVKGPITAIAGAGAFGLLFLGVNEVALLVAAGLLVMLAANRGRLRGSAAAGLLFFPAGSVPAMPAAAGSVPLLKLFLVFLKIGSVLFGSGYVLLAFLRADLVERYGWLTEQQLIDAVAVGQFTPGPVFTTATFIGYVMAGVPGALVATLGIFLPAFVFVALTHPFIPRLRRSPWLGAFLDGVNVASLALMAAVTLQFGRAALVDPLTVLLAAATLAVLLRWKVNSAWLVLSGAAAGLVVKGLL